MTDTTFTDHNAHEPCDTHDADGNGDDLCPPATTTTTKPVPATTTSAPVATTTTTTVVAQVPPPPPTLPNTGSGAAALGGIGFTAVLIGALIGLNARRYRARVANG